MKKISSLFLAAVSVVASLAVEASSVKDLQNEMMGADVITQDMISRYNALIADEIRRETGENYKIPRYRSQIDREGITRSTNLQAPSNCSLYLVNETTDDPVMKSVASILVKKGYTLTPKFRDAELYAEVRSVGQCYSLVDCLETQSSMNFQSLKTRRGYVFREGYSDQFSYEDLIAMSENPIMRDRNNVMKNRLPLVAASKVPDCSDLKI